MTWNWGHSPEAYANARDNLFGLPREELAVILAEWEAHDREQRGKEPFPRKYFKRIRRLTFGTSPHLDPETTAEMIWGRMEEQALCTNGGSEAWTCPYGCHLVSFSTPEEDESREE